MLDSETSPNKILRGDAVEIPAGLACDTQLYVATCPDCGECVLSWMPATLHVCRVRDRSPQPSLLTKAANFTKSAAAHVAAGMPRASEAEIERRFAICQGCEHYDGKACTRCGCPVVRESRFVSKLSWANESCPVGKWGKEEVG